MASSDRLLASKLPLVICAVNMVRWTLAESETLLNACPIERDWGYMPGRLEPLTGYALAIVSWVLSTRVVLGRRFSSGRNVDMPSRYLVGV